MINESQNLYYLKVLTWFSSFVIVLFHYSLWFGLDYYEENILIDYLVRRKEYGANFVSNCPLSNNFSLASQASSAGSIPKAR